MPATTWNDQIAAGEDFVRLYWEEQPDGSPVDYTGCTASGTVKRTRDDDAAATYDCSIVEHPVTTDDNHAVQIVLTDTETASLEPGTYVHDLWLTRSDGSKEQVLEGTLTITHPVTP